MTPIDIHFCLVSAQVTPNLLPLLDEIWRPRKVVLACSAQMKHAAQALRAFGEDAKSSGLVARLIERHGVRGLSVAPPAA